MRGAAFLCCGALDGNYRLVRTMFVRLKSYGIELPSRRTFNPRPVRLAGRCTTSIASIKLGSSFWSLESARSEAMLKLSEPQKRIRSGERVVAVELKRRVGVAGKERTGRRSLHNIVGSRWGVVVSLAMPLDLRSRLGAPIHDGDGMLAV